MVNRTHVQILIRGRNTMGVRVMDRRKARVASLAKVVSPAEEESRTVVDDEPVAPTDEAPAEGDANACDRRLWLHR
jgi:hypothetical protein